MTFAKKLYLIAVGAIIVLSAGNASAQLPMPGIDLMKESSRPLILGETFVRQQRHLRNSN
jgi:hypothetical protein